MLTSASCCRHVQQDSACSFSVRQDWDISTQRNSTSVRYRHESLDDVMSSTREDVIRRRHVLLRCADSSLNHGWNKDCVFCLMSWCLSWRSWCAAALTSQASTVFIPRLGGWVVSFTLGLALSRRRTSTIRWVGGCEAAEIINSSQTSNTAPADHLPATTCSSVICLMTSRSPVGMKSGELSRNSGGLLAGRPGFDFRQGQRPDRLWGPPSLLSNGYRGGFPQW
jgi:hypothetical protein